MAQDHGNSLTRSLKIASGAIDKNLWLRLAEGSTITPLGNNLYATGDHQYYIKLASHKKVKPVIRKSAQGQELILSGSMLNGELNYTLIW